MSTIRKAGSRTVQPDSKEAKRITDTHGFPPAKATGGKGSESAKGSTKQKEGEA